MANGVSIKQLEEIIESEEVPQRVSNRILYAAIFQQTASINGLAETVKLHQVSIEELQRRMTDAEADRSIIWRLQNRPVETMKAAGYLMAGLSGFGWLIHQLTLSASIP